MKVSLENEDIFSYSILLTKYSADRLVEALRKCLAKNIVCAIPAA